ncbi:NDP-sugar synthase [Haloarcula litorea]|uniref:NDP-sugar synthase n=1 Tax=Haloarcula litorea TaxID=3032579 RepID=UPI0023E783A3|nr:NDP-sugar synthase [Halomicroarcula sp. GDY20]
MKAVVLAGGYATRLWPITRDRPKPLLPVGDTTPLGRILSGLETEHRVDRVYVSTNARFGDRVRSFVADGPYEKATVSVEESTAEAEKLGVVGGLSRLVDREGIDDDLLVVGGDNLYSFAVSSFVDFVAERDDPCLAAYDLGDRSRATEYGVVSLDGDRVTSFHEKPDRPASSLVSVACYGFPAASLSKLDDYLAAGNDPDEPGRFLQWLQARDAVRAFTFDGEWFDIGTPRGYLDAVAWHLDGDTMIAEGATVENSSLGDAVHVMDGAEIVDSDLHRTVVFPEVTIDDCSFSDSIVDRHAHLSALARREAVVGSHSRIVAGTASSESTD